MIYIVLKKHVTLRDKLMGKLSKKSIYILNDINQNTYIINTECIFSYIESVKVNHHAYE